MDALKKTGVTGALFGQETGEPWMFYLPCGRPVFELALVALAEMADRLEAAGGLVTVDWSDGRVVRAPTPTSEFAE
ncbi:hypothetical protein [Methylosinus sp. Sm6]|uniref:hypothetical protein n=1 Tax=Methylosinus sp. Sm6 TaxID=2866948 RepID=UPI001C98EBE2|nr:hypothetical protein [Methylosinus sp. Sm6]